MLERTTQWEASYFYSSPHSIRTNHSKVDEMEKAWNMHMSNTYKVLIWKPEGKRPLGRITVNRNLLLNWILKNRALRFLLNSSGLEKDPVAGSCEDDDKPFGFKKRQRISWPPMKLLLSQEVLSSLKWAC
jgi:hypothetical protein